MSERETSAEIEAAAAAWSIRVDNDAPLDRQEQVRLEDWLAGDTRRLGAFARARATLLHARRAKALGATFDPDGYLRAQTMDGDGAVALTAAETASEPRRPVSRRALLAGGSAMAAAGMLTLFGFSWRAAAQTYSTARGEIRLIPLADGSTMTLNTASTLRVKFTETERHIDLIEGEALFDVAHDANRPFIVEAGKTRVRAVGTSFTVSRIAQRPLEVLVRQGVVEVEGSHPGQEKNRVTVNSKAVIGQSSRIAITSVEPSQMSRELAWREGMLSFEDRPLREAASEFARYSKVQIHFDDDSIGDETVTGLFAANNPAGFAQSVALSLRLQARTETDGILLSRPN